MKRIWLITCLLSGLLVASQGWAMPSLQIFIDLTPVGGTLRPPPGTYSGPIVISKPITLDGQGEVVIDAGGKGTVLSIKADRVTVRNMRLTNSGPSHDQVDAGIMLSGNDSVIESNIIDDTLFGIHLQQANNNIVRGNRISSRPFNPSLRGEGIRLWYSRENLIESNAMDTVRDMVLANSPENRILGNSISNSRIGMELIFSPDNLIEGNHISDGTTGLVVLYSDGVKVRNNRIIHMRNSSSSALAVKSSSKVVVEGNDIVHCAMGIIANSPTHPENIIFMNDNRFAFNDVAMYFYGESGGHIVHGNRFDNNIIQIAVSAPGSALGNDWRGNVWQNYQGFDLDGDGIGDRPHEIYLYSDRIWMDRPMTKFFRSSPAMEMIDFIERLAPFDKPYLILQDPAPKMQY
jgi:nitrous oxidase accessory protein